MDFHLDADQQALQEAVSQFCESRWPVEGLAERPRDAFDRSVWNEFVELGLPGLLAPEASGGPPRSRLARNSPAWEPKNAIVW